MMSDRNAIPHGGETSPIPASGKAVWLVTADEQLSSRIHGLLGTLGCAIVPIRPEMTQSENPWDWARTKPGIVVLYIDQDVDWGQGILDGIQRGRRDTPVVVLTQAFSREFGAKIISRGASFLALAVGPLLSRFPARRPTEGFGVPLTISPPSRRIRRYASTVTRPTMPTRA